jgi:hypothetical protein
LIEKGINCYAKGRGDGWLSSRESDYPRSSISHKGKDDIDEVGRCHVGMLGGVRSGISVAVDAARIASFCKLHEQMEHSVRPRSLRQRIGIGHKPAALEHLEIEHGKALRRRLSHLLEQANVAITRQKKILLAVVDVEQGSLVPIFNGSYCSAQAHSLNHGLPGLLVASPSTGDFDFYSMIS